MPLKSLDLLVSLKIAISGQPSWTYAELGESLGLSASETNQAVRRSLAAGLLVPAHAPDAKPGPMTSSLLEFIRHGIRYAFFEAPGPIRRGMPTAHSAPPLKEILPAADSPPLVWPDPQGESRGQEFRPLYKTVPAASRRDPALYEVLALLDAVRGGRAREKKLALELIEARLSKPHGR